MSLIAVIDYGMGNLRSVVKALEHVAPKARVVVSDAAATLRRADRLVFPGQGAIGDAMAQIKQRALIETIHAGIRGKPFLGLCLGLQVLMSHSDENNGVEGLNEIPGQVRHFKALHAKTPQTTRLKIPHMGWNQVYQTQDHPLWKGIEDGSRFYFVHSYYVEPENGLFSAGVCDYGGEFVVAAAHAQFFAVQFHPEKSQKAGLRLLQNFVNWDV